MSFVGRRLASAVLVLPLLVPLGLAPFRSAVPARECCCAHEHGAHALGCACPVHRDAASPRPPRHGGGTGARCEITNAPASPVALITVLDELFRGATATVAPEASPPLPGDTTRWVDAGTSSRPVAAPPTPPPQVPFLIV